MLYSCTHVATVGVKGLRTFYYLVFGVTVQCDLVVKYRLYQYSYRLTHT